MKPTVNVVWFKRDRAPLAEACRREWSILLLYLLWPMLLDDPYYSPRILASHVRPDRGGMRRGAQKG